MLDTTMLGPGARRALTAAILVLAAPTLAGAQALPPARQVVDRWVQAIGGEHAVLSRDAIHSTGTFSMAGMGVNGTLETFQAAPHRTLMRIDIPQFGVVKQGYNGDVAWSVNPMEGPRLLEGKELASARDEAELSSMLRPASLIASMETLERGDVNGQACYKVKITWKSGRETTDCYAVDSGLLLSTALKAETPQGSIDAVMLFEDYKDFGGVKFPTVMRQRMMGQEQVLRIESIEFGDIDPSVFDLPPEIQALVTKK